MAKTLGERLDSVNEKIEKAESAQILQDGDQQVSRPALFRLYGERDRLEALIDVHGRNYIPGQNTTARKAVRNVIFS